MIVLWLVSHWCITPSSEGLWLVSYLCLTPSSEGLVVGWSLVSNALPAGLCGKHTERRVDAVFAPAPPPSRQQVQGQLRP